MCKTILVRFIALSALAFSVGCSSGPQVDPAVLSAATSRGVAQSTCSKMSSATPLDYQDIMNLVSKGVPSTTVIGYLNSTRRVYNFSYSQLAALKSAGATPQVLNYLSETQGFYGNNTPRTAKRGDGVPHNVRVNSPLYQDEQPFAYNEPIVDDWYDSSYEESLYSPFSFN